MKIIRQTANPSGAYPSPQDWSGQKIPEGMALWPDDLDTADFYAHNGFVALTVEQVETVIGQQEVEVPGEEDGAPGVELQDVTAVLPTVTAYAPNTEAWEAWTAEHPAPDPLETAREAKLAELSAACNGVIVAGCDVTLSDGTTGHISLTAEDQINLTNAYASVSAGAAEYPYHLDGQLCAMYPAEDIVILAQAATAHKLYHTTYYNHLREWVGRCETVEEVTAITYGAELPEDFASSMAVILEAASNA